MAEVYAVYLSNSEDRFIYMLTPEQWDAFCEFDGDEAAAINHIEEEEGSLPHFSSLTAFVQHLIAHNMTLVEDAYGVAY